MSFDTNRNKWQKRYQHIALKTDETWKKKVDEMDLTDGQKAEVEAIVEFALSHQMPLGLVIQPGSKAKMIMPSFTSKKNFGECTLFNSLGSLRRAIERTRKMSERMHGFIPDWLDESKLNVFRVVRESETK